MRAWIVCAVGCLASGLSASAAAAEEVEFEGTPRTRVEVAMGSVSSEAVSGGEAMKRRVRIVRDGNQYLWASRNNTPLMKIDSGDYVTYLAPSGVGYVRVLSGAKAAGRSLSYVEHITVQMGSITYYGN